MNYLKYIILSLCLVVGLPLWADDNYGGDDNWWGDTPGDPTTSYVVTTTANPAAGALLSGSGLYEKDATATITCSPAPGYTFVRWLKDGVEHSTSRSFTYTATASAAFVAELQAIPSHTVSVTANPAAGASVTGAGTYFEGQTVSLTCTPADDYEFLYWTLGGVEFSSSASCTYTMATKNAKFVAVCRYAPKNTFVAETDGSVGAKVTISGGKSGETYPMGKELTITAAATTSEYVFLYWNLNSVEQYSTDASLSFTMPDSAVHLVAVFDWLPVLPDDPTLYLTSKVYVSALPKAGATVTPASGLDYAEGSTVTVTATPATNYTFDGWFLGETLLSSDLSYTYTVGSASVTLTAKTTYVEPQPQVGDTKVIDGITYTWDGTQWQAPAAPDPGEGGETGGEEEPYDPYGGDDNWWGDAPDDPVDAVVLVTLTSAQPAFGSVSGSGYYSKDTNVTIKATPADDSCSFISWSDGDTNPVRVIKLTEALTLTATFAHTTRVYRVSLYSDCSVVNQD